MNAATWTILGYLALVPLLGVLFNRHLPSAAAWATAGGGMGVVMIAAGVAGTRIGGVGTYGVAGAVMNTGIWNLWYGINTFLALALVGLVFTRPYRRLKLTTIGELFEQRYGTSRCGWLTSLCVQSEYFVVNIIEPLLIGVIISNVLGIELVAGIIMGSVVIIMATAVSGLKGTSFTNIIHCGVITCGLGLVAWVGAQQMGGVSGVMARADSALLASGKDLDAWWSMVGLGWLPIIAMFFSATIHTPATSVYVNFSSSARSERVLIPAFLLAGLLAALMSFLAAFIGVEALAKYGADAGIAGYNSVTRIAMDSGPLLGGIAIAAVLAALISSGGPVLLASSTMVVNDWIPASKHFTHTRKLRAYRITSVAYGALAALIACYCGYVLGTASVLQWLLLGYAMVVPPAIAIGNIFYVRATTEAAVFWGIATGYGLGLLAWLLNKLVWQLGLDVTAYITTLLPLVVIPNVSLFMQPAGPRLAAWWPAFCRLRATAVFLVVLGLLALAGLYAGVYGGNRASATPWRDGALVYALLAPVLLTGAYGLLAGATKPTAAAWGVLGGWALSGTVWWLSRRHGLLGDTVYLYIATCWPLVVVPTLSLLRQADEALDERAASFYRRLRTPA